MANGAVDLLSIAPRQSRPDRAWNPAEIQPSGAREPPTRGTITRMFCPKCRVEYQPGFKTCSDCGVDLVAALPPRAKAPAAGHDHEAPVAIWRGDDPVAFSAAMAALEEAGIPTRELSLHDQFTQILAIQPNELVILVHPENAVLAEQAIREALTPNPPGPETV